jgi:hypothetical protein
MRGYNNFGRYSVKRPDGRVFCVEPLIDKQFVKRDWGNASPGSGKWTGPAYEPKNPGGVKSTDSIITEDNGFKNIITLPPGVSPNSYIEDQ